MYAEKPDFVSRFPDAVGRPCQEGVFLKNYSNFKVGGSADYFFEARTEKEIVSVLRFVKTSSLPYYIIGGGYNILFSDEGFRGLIIRNSIKGLNKDDKKVIKVKSGTPLKELVDFCLHKRVGGLEFLAGIPGTVGGAVCGNAGAFGCDIGSLLMNARILTEFGKILQVEKNYFRFEYRGSRLKINKDVLLDVRLQGKTKAQEEIKKSMNESLQTRKKKHPPYGTASAGSYFKNPVLPSGEKVAAAALLDQVDAKEKKTGDAAVYSGHANFIINQGNATSQDIRLLAGELKQKVYKKFRVKLEEEVIFLPAEP
jgi:UDP-N-acetylmuramate dehydrogenase